MGWNRKPNTWQNKYKNIVCKASDGRSFHSQLERYHYDNLTHLEKSGVIIKVECQLQVKLGPGQIIYKPDFRVTHKNGEVIYHEVKGMETDRWKMIKKLWRAHGPAELQVYKGKVGRILCSEIIKPDPQIEPQFKCPNCSCKNCRSA